MNLFGIIIVYSFIGYGKRENKMKKDSIDDIISSHILGIFVTVGILIVLPTALTLQFSKHYGILTFLATIVFLIAIISIIFTMSNLGVSNQKIGLLETILIIVSDNMILISLSILSSFISMIFFGCLKAIFFWLELCSLSNFFDHNINMILIFFTFSIQLLLFIFINTTFKKFFLQKKLGQEVGLKAFEINKKIYQSVTMQKVYGILSNLITVVLIGVGKDYNVDSKLPYYDGPLSLFFFTLSIYIMNSYILYITPNKNSTENVENVEK